MIIMMVVLICLHLLQRRERHFSIPSGDDDDDLNAAQLFLLQRPQTERVAEANGQELTRTKP